MARSLITNKRLNTPCFVFVNCGGEYSDADLLKLFHISDYQRTGTVEGFGPYALLADADSWKLIADDWQYTLWNMTTTGSAVADLAGRHDLFACSVGECDHSFDFVYYKDSRLIRKHVVVDPTYCRREVVEDFGDPLPGEVQAFKQQSELQVVMGIAESIGIRTTFEERDLRIYAPTKSRRRWWDVILTR